MSVDNTDLDVERAVGVVLQGALKRLDALKEEINPSPRLSAEDLTRSWAELAEQSRQLWSGLVTAVQRASAYLTIELFGSNQQREQVRRLMNGGK